MKITTQQILKVLHVLSWIIFAGICVEAGAFIVHTILMLVQPEDAPYYWKEVDLTALYRFSSGYFTVEMSLISLAAVLKAWMFYRIIQLLHEKQLDLVRPFSEAVGRFVARISYVSLAIGMISLSGMEIARWLTEQGAQMPDSESMRLGGADVWLFMGIILFVIAQIFKRGIEIQSENELTV